MSEAITLTHIHEDILALRREIEEVKDKIADMDVVLTDEDVYSLKEAEKDFKAGKTKRLN